MIINYLLIDYYLNYIDIILIIILNRIGKDFKYKE